MSRFALIGAGVLNDYVPGLNYTLKDAASIGIIGGADGPTAIWLTTTAWPSLSAARMIRGSRLYPWGGKTTRVAPRRLARRCVCFAPTATRCAGL